MYPFDGCGSLRNLTRIVARTVAFPPKPTSQCAMLWCTRYCLFGASADRNNGCTPGMIMAAVTFPAERGPGGCNICLFYTRVYIIDFRLGDVPKPTRFFFSSVFKKKKYVMPFTGTHSRLRQLRMPIGVRVPRESKAYALSYGFGSRDEPPPFYLSLHRQRRFQPIDPRMARMAHTCLVITN